MKNSALLFVIIICFLASCTEVTNPTDIENIEEYMPLSIGNYWVYDVYDSLYNRSYIDSMVVVSDTVIKSRKMFVVHNFRNGSIRDTGYYCNSDNSIALYGKVLMPLLLTPDAFCFSKQTKKIYSIIDEKYDWSYRDSVIADSFPSLVPDPIDPRGWSFENSKTANILTMQSSRDIKRRGVFNNHYFDMINVDFDGIRKLRILEPEKQQFQHVEGYEYFENNRVVIGNKLILKLKFAKGVGIIYSYEKAWLSWSHCQTRNLLRYKVK